MRLFSMWIMLLMVVIELVNHCDGSDYSDRERSLTGGMQAKSTSGSSESLGGSCSDVDDSSSGESTSSTMLASATTVAPEIESIEPPMPQTIPTTAPPTTTAMGEPVVEIESDSINTIGSSSQSFESSAPTSEMTQSTTSPVAGAIVSSESNDYDSFDSTSSSEASESSYSDYFDTTGSSSEALSNSESEDDGESEDDDEASIAQPGSDSSTFQYVASAECSKEQVDNVYTLYSNCRSAFDLCVSASDYQIFPFHGKHPTQTQIQGMVESDACIAVFIVVIKANFSACTIGGMPLVGAAETLLKISVDLQEGFENEAPSTDVFRELLAWRYAVDLAKAAGVPYDGSSDLYSEFETNLNAALKDTAIRVNKDLSVDVRLTNGSYEALEDAIDLVVADASVADLARGYVIASSGSSSSPTGIVSESSIAVTSCTPTMWSLVVAVITSAFMLSQWRV